MEVFTHTDPSFDLNKTEQYHISIQAGLNGYAFVIMEIENNKYLAGSQQSFGKHVNMDDVREKFGELLNNDKYLSKQYKSVYFAPLDSKSTIIPQAYYDKDSLQHYANLNFTPDSNEFLETDKLEKLNMVNLYTMDSHFSTLLRNKYKNAKTFHPGTSLIINALGYPYNKVNITRVFAEVQPNRLLIAITNANEFLFYNTFHYQTTQDLIYYVMNVFEKHKLNPERTPLMLSGQILINSEPYNQIKRFFPAMKFRRLNNKFSYTREFNQVPEHLLVNLFNLVECES